MNSPDPEERREPAARPGRAIVAGHGDFASGIVSAVAQITGRGEVFVALSNRGLGADDIERTMRDTLLTSGARVIFTDLPAGSCTIAARRIQRERAEVVVVTGANLASLLDFVFHAEAPAVEAANHAADKGRTALTVIGAPGAR